MPSGIILSSGSQGATQEDIEKVLAANGYEPETTEAVTEAPAEPKRDDFESDEAFEQAQEEFETAQEEAAQKAEDEEEEKAERARSKETVQRPSRRQRAIDKATAKLQEDLRKANERLAVLESKQPTARTEAKKEPEQPKRENFKTDAEFEDAMFDYRYKLRRAKEQADEAKNSVETRHRETLTNYQTQVAAFKQEHDDWDEVVNQPIPIHESVQLAIIELENGAQVTYYLGKHPDYARTLAEMTPLKAVVEIGRLADKLKPARRAATTAAEDKSGKPKPRTKALPEPVRPVSTSATSSTLTSKEAAHKRDFRAFKAAQRRGA